MGCSANIVVPDAKPLSEIHKKSIPK